jgi:cysteine synthase A
MARMLALVLALAAPAAAFQPSMVLGLKTLRSKLGMSSVAGRGDGRGGVYEDITQTIGNTPCVKISAKMGVPEGVEVYAKCEFFNPLSSVKDRLALAIIEAAEARGELKAGDTVVEATSGNTGIAVAMLCAQRGYKCVVTMAEPFFVERLKSLGFLPTVQQLYG